RDICRGADDGDDVFLEVGVGDGASKGAEGVEFAHVRVHQVGVVILPAGLMFFRAPVVVDRHDSPARFAGRAGQEQGGLTAVTSDLDSGALTEISACRVVQRDSLVGWHESGGLGGFVEQAGGHGHACQSRGSDPLGRTSSRTGMDNNLDSCPYYVYAARATKGG